MNVYEIAGLVISAIALTVIFAASIMETRRRFREHVRAVDELEASRHRITDTPRQARNSKPRDDPHAGRSWLSEAFRKLNK